MLTDVVSKLQSLVICLRSPNCEVSRSLAPELTVVFFRICVLRSAPLLPSHAGRYSLPAAFVYQQPLKYVFDPEDRVIFERYKSDQI